MSRLRSPSSVVFGVICLTVAIGVVGVMASGGEKPAPSLVDTGRPETQIEAEHSAGRAQFEAHLAVWYAQLDVSKLDLQSLPRSDLDVTLAPPLPTFRAAISASKRIVIGSVSAIKPGQYGTDVTLVVERTLRGQSEAVVHFLQDATIGPLPDWKSAIILDSPGGALLLPGTRGEFLLDGNADGSLQLQESTGEYVFAADGIRMSKMNLFQAQFQSATESDLVQATLLGAN